MANDSVGQVQQLQTIRTEGIGSISQHSGGYLQFRSDPTPIVRELQRAFCGNEWDVEKRCWVKVEHKSLANDEFMRRVIPIIHSYVNQNTPRGNITELEAHKICERVTDELIFLIGLENVKFGISDENFDAIVNTFDDLIFITLTRAIGDGERNHEDNIFRVNENVRGASMQGTGKPFTKMYGG
jgi:hypothetical protein